MILSGVLRQEHLCDLSCVPALDEVVDQFALPEGETGRPTEEVDSLGDQDTADLITEGSRASDKHLWFVEGQLQA